MKFAITIGSYQMPQFVELQVRSLRRVFGEQVPLLISDDWSDCSVQIRDLAAELDVHHIVGGPRGHFGGDMAAGIHGLAFAKQEGADIAIKVSQRFLLVEPVVKSILERYFSDENTWLLLPGKVHPATIPRAESRFFSNFFIQTDCVCIRTGTLTPEELKRRYEEAVAVRTRFAAYVEKLFMNLMDTVFAGHTVICPELTHPFPGRSPLFLRRCQSEPAQYQKLGEELGMKSFVPILSEWSRLSRSYKPIPRFVEA